MENATETTLIPVLNNVTRIIPVICPWCGRIFKTVEWQVKEGDKIAPTHGICKNCHDFLLKDMAFENIGLEHRE